VLQVPVLVLRPGVLGSKDQLVTRRAPGYLHHVREITTTEKLVVGEEVEKIFKHLPTSGAVEAARMPAFVFSGSFCKDCHLSRLHGLPASAAVPNLSVGQVACGLLVTMWVS